MAASQALSCAFLVMPHAFDLCMYPSPWQFRSGQGYPVASTWVAGGCSSLGPACRCRVKEIQVTSLLDCQGAGYLHVSSACRMIRNASGGLLICCHSRQRSLQLHTCLQKGLLLHRHFALKVSRGWLCWDSSEHGQPFQVSQAKHCELSV